MPRTVGETLDRDRGAFRASLRGLASVTAPLYWQQERSGRAFGRRTLAARIGMMTDAGERTSLPARVQSPEALELERKRAELATLERELVERELELSTLEGRLGAFRAEYLRVVGVIRQIAQVRRRFDSINRAIQALQAGELHALWRRCHARSDEGVNLLDEMAARLDREIAAARKELGALTMEAR